MIHRNNNTVLALIARECLKKFRSSITKGQAHDPTRLGQLLTSLKAGPALLQV